MSDRDNWGEYNESSSWRQTLDGMAIWHTTDKDDPYHTLRMINAEHDWFETTMSAKTVVERMTEESGEELEFYFCDTCETSTISDRFELSEMSIKCRFDPLFFLEHYKAELHYPRMYGMLAKAAVKKYYGKNVYVCIRPSCSYLRVESELEKKYSVVNCNSCGHHTQIISDILINQGAPDPCLMGFALANYKEIRTSTIKAAAMARMVDENEHISLDIVDYYPRLIVSAKFPGIIVEGEHFIRGRANREVLLENGFIQAPLRNYDTGLIEEGQEDVQRFNNDLYMHWHSSSMSGIKLIAMIIENPNPKVFLDPSRAEKFRAEYVEARWESEFASFVSELIDKKILKVDSSGVHDTLTTLYHIAQRKAGKKTVIKKDGKIVFPTKEVLEIINPKLMTHAFNTTEHAQYVNADEVFKLDTE
jgi:hypothetical protein